jgi:hypothetical protein
VARQEREILERAVHTIAEKAAATDAVVDEALDGRAGMKGPPGERVGGQPPRGLESRGLR